MKSKWFSIAHITSAREWLAAHPETKLRLVPVANGFFIVRTIALAIAVAILAPLSASAESRWAKAAKWTAAAVVATSAADAATSWGRPELHPALGPHFGYRGLAIKALGTASYVAVQRIRGRDHRNAKAITITNIAVAAIFGSAAIYNHRLNAPRQPQPIIITPGRTTITWTPCADPTCGGVFASQP